MTGAELTLYRSRDGRTFTLKSASSFDELDACVALEQETWRYPDLQVVPRTMFVLAQALGGHVVGAWSESGDLAGFALAVPAHQPCPKPGAGPVAYLHSHMLAVAPGYRDQGLGRALKFWQRQEALQRGIALMRWTFDPLVAKNAFFNLERLGATSRVYLPDFYGRREPLPTDRLLAEWRLDAPAATRLGAGREPLLRVPLPASGEQGNTERTQSALRARFREAFADGWIATGFQPGPDGGGEYLLSRPSGPVGRPE